MVDHDGNAPSLSACKTPVLPSITNDPYYFSVGLTPFGRPQLFYLHHLVINVNHLYSHRQTISINSSVVNK